ncbi:MAG: hypothetical protein IGR80_05340 [Synechococcales cyanobacterium K44_A2020_017]|nr:hypothetical protein [Synechococcales cyanobacterium K32_A2020_035]MBF2094166.1 hypothetical protein [Synechococcales cyanobacterium K44_A2020_017]
MKLGLRLAQPERGWVLELAGAIAVVSFGESSLPTMIQRRSLLGLSILSSRI